MKSIAKFGAIALGLSTASLAWAGPAQVILLRHAEKAATGPSLSPQGDQRAAALPKFFETNAAADRFGEPVAIYVEAPHGKHTTLRAIETMTPLAQSLDLQLNEEAIGQSGFQDMVNEIMGNSAYDGKTVVVCWEHKDLPVFAQDFGASQAPSSWSGSVFDRAWVLGFTGGQVTSFQDVAQDLLPGDSPI